MVASGSGGIVVVDGGDNERPVLMHIRYKPALMGEKDNHKMKAVGTDNHGNKRPPDYY